MVEVICDNCGRPFSKRRSKVKEKNFHNNKCKFAYYKKYGRQPQDLTAFYVVKEAAENLRRIRDGEEICYQEKLEGT